MKKNSNNNDLWFLNFVEVNRVKCRIHLSTLGFDKTTTTTTVSYENVMFLEPKLISILYCNFSCWNKKIYFFFVVIKNKIYFPEFRVS